MKKAVITVLIICCAILLASCGQTASKIFTKEPEEEALYAYSEFLAGNMELKNGEETVSVTDLLYYYGKSEDINEKSIYDKYAICDINNDGISELLISSNRTYILIYKNDNLSMWWSDEYWSGYSQILVNNSILHIRPGGAPTHITYHYLVLDENGAEKEHIRFEKYDSDEDGIYDFFIYQNEDDLSQDEWEQKTQMYLSVKEIEWNEYLGTESFI